jgi:hypothetical protein
MEIFSSFLINSVRLISDGMFFCISLLHPKRIVKKEKKEDEE